MNSWAKNSSNAYALLFLVAVCVYVNTLGNQFVSDDNWHIQKHPYVRSLDQLYAIATTDHLGGQRGGYRPVTVLTFALNYHFGGLNPSGYHVVNLFLHGLNSALVYGVAMELLISFPLALVTGLLFAVHPVHTEAVAWISGRAELLVCFFLLSSWFLYLKATAGGQVHRLQLRLAVLCYCLALFSKEQAVMFPAILLVSDLFQWRQGRLQRARLITKLLQAYPIYLAALGTYLLVRHLLFPGQFPYSSHKIPFLDNPLVAAPFNARVLTAFAVLGDYIKLLIWPIRLSFDYSYDQIPLATSLWEPRVMFGIGTVGSMLLLAGWSFRQRGIAWVAILFTLITLAPISNLFTVIGTIMAERVLYLPSIGVSVLAAMVWCHVATWVNARFGIRLGQNLAVLLISVVLITLAGRTLLRNQDWANEWTLWGSAAQVSPGSAKVYAALAALSLRSGRIDEAIRYSEKALSIYPDYGGARFDLGVALIKEGRLEEAIQSFEQVLAKFPRNADAWSNLGSARMKMGQLTSARHAFEQALLLRPSYPEFAYNLGNLSEQEGNYQDAVLAYEAALDQKRGSADLHLRTARLYWERLDVRVKALKHLCQAIALEKGLEKKEELHALLEQWLAEIGQDRCP